MSGRNKNTINTQLLQIKDDPVTEEPPTTTDNTASSSSSTTTTPDSTLPPVDPPSPDVVPPGDIVPPPSTDDYGTPPVPYQAPPSPSDIIDEAIPSDSDNTNPPSPALSTPISTEGNTDSSSSSSSSPPEDIVNPIGTDTNIPINPTDDSPPPPDAGIDDAPADDNTNNTPTPTTENNILPPIPAVPDTPLPPPNQIIPPPFIPDDGSAVPVDTSIPPLPTDPSELDKGAAETAAMFIDKIASLLSDKYSSNSDSLLPGDDRIAPDIQNLIENNCYYFSPVSVTFCQGVLVIFRESFYDVNILDSSSIENFKRAVKTLILSEIKYAAYLGQPSTDPFSYLYQQTKGHLDQMSTALPAVAAPVTPPFTSTDPGATPRDNNNGFASSFIKDLKYHLNFKFPGVYDQEGDDNQDPGTDDRISRACSEYIEILSLPASLCNGIHEVIRSKTANVFNAGYIDNLETDFKQWISEHVNDPAAEQQPNAFNDLPPNYQIEFSGHFKFDFSNLAGSSEDQIKSQIKNDLIGRISTVPIPSERVTLLSYTPDVDQQGVTVEVSVLPPQTQESQSSAVIATAISNFFSQEAMKEMTEYETQGTGTAGPSGDEIEGEETPAPVDSQTVSGNGNEESAASVPVIAFPYAAYHGSSDEKAAQAATIATTSTTTTSTPLNSSASSLSASFVLSIVLALLML